MSRALATLFNFVKSINVAIEEERLAVGDRDRTLAAVADADRVFGVLNAADWAESQEPQPTDALSDDQIEALVEERRRARSERAFSRADEIRDRLTGVGIVLEDTPQETRWKRT